MLIFRALAAGVNDVPAVIPVMSKQSGKESQELIENGSGMCKSKLSRKRLISQIRITIKGGVVSVKSEEEVGLRRRSRRRV